MNSIKYKNTLYQVPKINNLKELINGTVEKNRGKVAFLQKWSHHEPYIPITYNQLQRDINGLGTSFINLGLKNKKIAIIGENSYQWVVSYFATVNGTGVVVPIDRELRAGEIGNLLKRAEVSAVVYSKKVRKLVDEVLHDKELGNQIDYLIQMDLVEDEIIKSPYKNGEDDIRLSFRKLIDGGEISLENGDRAFVDAHIDDEAMTALLFTSGTTGMAKGVMLSHKNITSNVYNMSKYVKIMKGGIGLSVLPMHHTYEMTCHIMTGLFQGMTLAICEGLKHIQSNLAEIPANVMLAVPLIFETMHKKIWKIAEKSGKAEKMRKMADFSDKHKLYNHPWLVKKIFKPVHKATGGAVSLFIAGGAAINPQVIRDYQAMGLPMIQGYGMTENAPIIAVNKDCYSKPESVGLPMPGTEVKIIDIDENGVGEIICRGPSVMLGYYKDEEATKEAIRDGWLYTGDYGYLDDDGFLYVSGRKKSVIVTKNGKNIFPEEVEWYLTEYDYIEEVLAHGVPGMRNDDVIVKAEIFLNKPLLQEEKGDLTEKEIENLVEGIIEEVNDKMPKYKRIKRYHIRKHPFEKTTTRKVKRHLASNLDESLLDK